MRRLGPWRRATTRARAASAGSASAGRLGAPNDRQWAADQRVSRDLVERLSPAPATSCWSWPPASARRACCSPSAAPHVISTDFAPAMVEAAQRLSTRLGVTGIEHRVVDAENIDLPDASVDGVLCRWGLMLFGDPVRALAEIRRVLRPGGRFACSVWATADANPWASVAGRAMAEAGVMPPPAPGEPGCSRSARRAGSRSSSARRGLPRSGSVRSTSPSRTPTSTSTGRSCSSSAARSPQAVAGLSAAEEQSLREEIERRLQPFATEDGIVFGGRCLNAVGTRLGSG